MTAPLFLVGPHGLDGSLEGSTLVLDGPEGHHAATVRRVRPGEQVDLADGEGALAHCRVRSVERDVVRLDVVGRVSVPASSPRLVVVQALPKGERGELAVEVLTEVGVDVVVPWAAARCVTQWRDARGDKALTRWRASAREAGKQARRPWALEVAALADTAGVVALLRAAALGVVLHEEADLPLAGTAVPDGGDVVVVVGPEGGVTGAELAAFAAVGAGAYQLGPSVLRTSTAGLAAAAVLLAGSGRWS